MALPGPFLAGQRLTAGQLNDATQKTIVSVDVNIAGSIFSGNANAETTITQFTLGPFAQVAGALYRVDTRVIRDQGTAQDEFILKMRKNTPLVGTLVASWNMWNVPAPGKGALFTGWGDFVAVADEPSVTYYFSVLRAVSTPGANNLIIYGHHTLDSVTPSGVKITRVGYASEFTVVVA